MAYLELKDIKVGMVVQIIQYSSDDSDEVVGKGVIKKIGSSGDWDTSLTIHAEDRPEDAIFVLTAHGWRFVYKDDHGGGKCVATGERGYSFHFQKAA